jgi:hypothetical protein
VTDKLLRSMTLAAMVLAGACDQSRPGTTIVATAPTIPGAPAVPTVTLSGTVIERFSGQPIPGAQVGLWPRTYPANRSWNWHEHLSTSDAAGHYRITGIDADFGSFWIYATTQRDLSQYMQQCATTVTLDADGSQDVTLTSRESLVAGNSRLPPRGPGTRTVSGAVFEVTETGRQPVAGASVGWEGDMDLVVAQTVTDTSGRYLLCGLPETRLDSLFALKIGYSRDGLYRIVEAGSDTQLDIELKR